jgi:hypothetical protein
MADSKISALSAVATLAGEDLIAIVDDPSGTPVSKKATISQISQVTLPGVTTAMGAASATAGLKFGSGGASIDDYNSDGRLGFNVGGSRRGDFVDIGAGVFALRIGDASLKTSGAHIFGNLSLTGNTLASTNANGNIALSPNGSGYVSIKGFTAGIDAAANSELFLVSNGAKVLEMYNAVNAMIRNDGQFLISSTAEVGSLAVPDTGLARVAAGVLRVSDGSTGTGWTVQSGRAYKTADESVTSSTTLQDDDHLTVTLKAGRKYAFRFFCMTNPTLTAGGMDIDLNGTATHTNIRGRVLKFYDDGTSAWQEFTAASAEMTLAAGAGLDHFVIEGTTEVNAAGTFLLRWAQNTSDATASTIKRGSYLEVIDLG